MAFLKAILDQDLVRGPLSLVPGDILYSRKPPGALLHSLKPASARRDVEMLVWFQRGLEHFAGKAGRGDAEAYGTLLAMVNTGIGYLDKVTVVQEDVAFAFAFDSLSWPVRLPCHQEELNKVVNRLRQRLRVGDHFRSQGLSAPTNRVQLIAYMLPRYMELVRTERLPLQGLAYAQECTELKPLNANQLHAWLKVAAKILRTHWDDLSKLEFREIDNIRDYEDLEYNVRDKFTDLVKRGFRTAAFSASSMGALAEKTAPSAPASNGDTRIGERPMPFMLAEDEHEHFVGRQIVLVDKLASRLAQATDAVSQAIWLSCSASDQEAIQEALGNAKLRPLLREFLRKVLNQHIARVVVYNVKSFQGVRIAPELLKRAEVKLAEESAHQQAEQVGCKKKRLRLLRNRLKKGMVRINRQLLEAYYRPLLAPKTD